MFGQRAGSLACVDLARGGYRLHGYCTPAASDAPAGSAEQQLLFVNGRAVGCARLRSLLDAWFRSALLAGGCAAQGAARLAARSMRRPLPGYLLLFACDPLLVDVTSEPDKSAVVWRQWPHVSALVVDALAPLWGRLPAELLDPAARDAMRGGGAVDGNTQQAGMPAAGQQQRGRSGSDGGGWRREGSSSGRSAHAATTAQGPQPAAVGTSDGFMLARGPRVGSRTRSLAGQCPQATGAAPAAKPLAAAPAPAELPSQWEATAQCSPPEGSPGAVPSRLLASFMAAAEAGPPAAISMRQPTALALNAMSTSPGLQLAVEQGCWDGVAHGLGRDQWQWKQCLDQAPLCQQQLGQRAGWGLPPSPLPPSPGMQWQPAGEQQEYFSCSLASPRSDQQQLYASRHAGKQRAFCLPLKRQHSVEESLGWMIDEEQEEQRPPVMGGCWESLAGAGGCSSPNGRDARLCSPLSPAGFRGSHLLHVTFDMLQHVQQGRSSMPDGAGADGDLLWPASPATSPFSAGGAASPPIAGRHSMQLAASLFPAQGLGDSPMGEAASPPLRGRSGVQPLPFQLPIQHLSPGCGLGIPQLSRCAPAGSVASCSVVQPPQRRPAAQCSPGPSSAGSQQVGPSQHTPAPKSAAFEFPQPQMCQSAGGAAPLLSPCVERPPLMTERLVMSAPPHSKKMAKGRRSRPLPGHPAASGASEQPSQREAQCRVAAAMLPAAAAHDDSKALAAAVVAAPMPACPAAVTQAGPGDPGGGTDSGAAHSPFADALCNAILSRISVVTGADAAGGGAAGKRAEAQGSQRQQHQRENQLQQQQSQRTEAQTAQAAAKVAAQKTQMKLTSFFPKHSRSVSASTAATHVPNETPPVKKRARQLSCPGQARPAVGATTPGGALKSILVRPGGHRGAAVGGGEERATPGRKHVRFSGAGMAASPAAGALMTPMGRHGSLHGAGQAAVEPSREAVDEPAAAGRCPAAEMQPAAPVPPVVSQPRVRPALPLYAASGSAHTGAALMEELGPERLSPPAASVARPAGGWAPNADHAARGGIDLQQPAAPSAPSTAVAWPATVGRLSASGRAVLDARELQQQGAASRPVVPDMVSRAMLQQARVVAQVRWAQILECHAY